MGVGKEGSGRETMGGGSSLGKELLVKPENRRFLVRRAEPRRALAKQVWLPHPVPSRGPFPQPALIPHAWLSENSAVSMATHPRGLRLGG